MQKSMISLLALASGAMAATHNVVVGGNGLTFVPYTVSAQVGDKVQFQFFGNHSVAQSEFSNPCVPSDHAPIFSGVISGPSPDSNDVLPTWTMDLLVNETLWLYCTVGEHCQKGMSMMVNVGNDPNPDQTIDKYQSAAAKVASAVAPTQTIGGTFQRPRTTDSDSSSAAATSGVAISSAAISGNSTATTTALSTTITSKASTVTATKSSGAGSASATGSNTATASGAAGHTVVPALGFAGLAGLAGLAAFMI